MTLESIVPSIEDCKRIPEGEFKESALVYVYFGFSCQEYGVACRDNCHHADVIIPAPTLAEILAKLPTIIMESDEYVFLAMFDTRNKDDMFQFGYTNKELKDVYKTKLKERDPNPATAALRLWFRLNGVQG